MPPKATGTLSLPSTAIEYGSRFQRMELPRTAGTWCRQSTLVVRVIYCRKSLLKRCPAKSWKQAPPHQPQCRRDTSVWLHPKRATYRKLQSVKAATQASLSKSMGVGLSQCVQKVGSLPPPPGPGGRGPRQRNLFSSLTTECCLYCGVLALFGTCHLFLSYFSLFVPVPSLYFENPWLVWFHRFTVREKFCLRMNQPQVSLVSNLEDTLDFRLSSCCWN